MATRWGRILLVRPDGVVVRLGGDVPMNKTAFQSHPDFNELRHQRFRVHDILLQAQGAVVDPTQGL